MSEPVVSRQKMHKEPVWAVCRLDRFHLARGEQFHREYMSIKLVTRDREFAQAEAVRLQALKPDGSSEYFVTSTRLVDPHEIAEWAAAD
jgi:hypothetical protein